MIKPPFPPDRLPTMEHAGVTIEPFVHHGFSQPNRGPSPKSRTLYGARDIAGERHWRGSYEEIVSLIDRNFETPALASGLAS
jgi:hypothetical protein